MKMKCWWALLLIPYSLSLFSQGLDLPGEVYRAPFERTICHSFEQVNQGMPEAFKKWDTELQALTSDAGLDLLKLSLIFKADQQEAPSSFLCQYDVLFTVNTHANLALYQDSAAYPTAQFNQTEISGSSPCLAGKKYFDSIMDFIPYFYDGSAGYMQVAFGFAVPGSREVCGPEAKQVLTVFGYQEN